MSLVQYWVTEHFLYEHRSEEHAKKRREQIDRFTGVMLGASDRPIETSPRGVPRPSWFRDVTEVDVRQLAAQAPRRRTRR